MMDTSPPSVAFFMHDLSGGGVERMRLRLAEALALRGHAVTLIVQTSCGELRSEVPGCIDLISLSADVMDSDPITSPNADTRAMAKVFASFFKKKSCSFLKKRTKKRFSVWRRQNTWRSVPALARVVRRVRPDFLVSSLDHNNVAALCAGVLAGARTHVIICQHNTLSAEAARGWRYRIVPILYRILNRRADAIIAVSQGVADDLAAVTGLRRGRITVIYNPIVPDCPVAWTNTPPHSWFADPLVPVFLFVGRLVAQKDPALLLRAFARRVKHGAARLILLGDGPLLHELQREAAILGITDSVHFAGFVVDPLPWMEHATALVLPSQYEGFGNVLIEAMSRSTPVIAMDCPHGPGEILAGGRFGWLVRVGDEIGLAAAMCDDVRASFPAERLMRRAQGFSVSACVARHQALFTRIQRLRRRAVFGLHFSRLDAQGVVARMLGQAPGNTVRIVVTPNLDHVRLMQARPEFADACRAADIVCADGFSVARYARSRGSRDIARVTGCDIFHALARAALLQRRKILVVAESEATERAVRTWGALQNATAYWTAVTAPAALLADEVGQLRLLRRIADAQPDMLVMALGAPASEVFLHRHRAALPPCWALCCGQAVRVELGLIRRAPIFLRRLNLEWAWRLLQEPDRMSLRYLRDAVMAPAMILADLRGDGPREVRPQSDQSGKGKESVLF